VATPGMVVMAIFDIECFVEDCPFSTLYDKNAGMNYNPPKKQPSTKNTVIQWSQTKRGNGNYKPFPPIQKGMMT